jgi:hypothetical protein
MVLFNNLEEIRYITFIHLISLKQNGNSLEDFTLEIIKTFSVFILLESSIAKIPPKETPNNENGCD